MSQLQDWLDVLLATIRDVLPILGILFGFQVLVLRQPLPNLRRVLTGFLYVFLGMAMFLEGLEHALFPLGKLMAQQLTAPEFILAGGTAGAANPGWNHYFWVYCFAALIGFSTTIAEPSLIAVAIGMGLVLALTRRSPASSVRFRAYPPMAGFEPAG